MNQVKKDLIMGIHSTHQLTCPFINSLQFISTKSSKTYVVELNASPSHLYINTNELIESMQDLNTWSKDILTLFQKLPENLKEEIIQKTVKKDIINEVKELLDIECVEKIKDYQKKINEVIKKWEEDNIEYKETIETINDLKKEIEEETVVMNITKNPAIKPVLEADIEEKKEVIEKLKTYIETLQEDFENQTREHFDKYTFEFSHYLEMVRRRNNEIREMMNDFRDNILSTAKHTMKYYQPIEFLNQKFGLKDLLSDVKSINLGIINNEIDYNNIIDFNKDGKWYFSKMLNYLKEKNAITSEQKYKLITEMEIIPEMKDVEYRKEKLLSVLESNGYENIRYYDSLKKFTENPNEPSIRNQEKLIKQRKIKP